MDERERQVFPAASRPARVRYGSWLLRIVAWDCILPAFVAVSPLAVQFLLPGRRGPVELVAVAVPLTALLIRIRAGTRHITSNDCAQTMKWFQLVALSIGILTLGVVDCLLILSHIMPQGAAIRAKRSLEVWTTLLPTYLVAMTIATYPGRRPAEAAYSDVGHGDGPFKV